MPRKKLSIYQRDLKDITFCFVDTENATPLKGGRILEIGAIKYKLDSKITAEFASLIRVPYVQNVVSRLTGITQDMLKSAPQERDVLARFKKFLGDSVFVAHSVRVDFELINERLSHFGMSQMDNPTLCTQHMIKKSLPTKKIGLEFLNSFLGINDANLHRALNDARCSLKIFQIAMITHSLDERMHTLQDLYERLK